MLSDYLKALWQYLLPKQALTRLAGFLANIETPVIKNGLIRYFLNKYTINMQEACEEDPYRYASFNAFFIRSLKPESRPIMIADIVSPVDGYVSEIGRISEGSLLQAKGRNYSVDELLACDKKLSAQFNKGVFATLYLSPKDYHRVHMPIEGRLKDMSYVPGQLFSVQPATARMIPRLFARNERLVVFFETPAGLMAMVLVGAAIVGAIGTSWGGDVTRKATQTPFPDLDTQTVLAKAAEMGYFKLGSTVIVLFAEGHRVQWQNDLSAGDKIRFGEALGEIAN
jgi:phosphatidylserine decarboxylase